MRKMNVSLAFAATAVLATVAVMLMVSAGSSRQQLCRRPRRD
jgi:hypothetical protein